MAAAEVPDDAPLPVPDGFDAACDVDLPGGEVFRVYTAGPADGPAVVALHGGGQSAACWALVAGHIKRHCRVIAPDFRGHGATRTPDDADLSADRLTADVLEVLDAGFGLLAADSPPLMVVGHSMGGTIAARVAASGRLPSLRGVGVLDVVEGTALAALGSMQDVLAARPDRFPSAEAAVEWAVRSGNIRNAASARVSVPTQLRPCADGSDGSEGVEWITDLAGSAPHWTGWFEGLSETFLGAPVAKLLVLAGMDRLDRTLTIAQMQGKFQLELIYGTGHAVHEDSPQQLGDVLVKFMGRNGIGGGGAGGEQDALAAKLARARAMRPSG